MAVSSPFSLFFLYFHFFYWICGGDTPGTAILPLTLCASTIILYTLACRTITSSATNMTALILVLPSLRLPFSESPGVDSHRLFWPNLVRATWGLIAFVSGICMTTSDCNVITFVILDTLDENAPL